MSERTLAELLDRAGAATPVSAPPLARIAAGARSRRRLRLAAVSGLALAAVAVVVGASTSVLELPGWDVGRPAGTGGSTSGTPDRGNLPSETELAGYVDGLEATLLPTLDELQVVYFMDEPDCAVLTYAGSGGDFVDGDPEQCGGSTGDPTPFNDAVRSDHTRVAAAVEASGTPIERVSATFVSDALRSAIFSSSDRAPFATTWEMLYDPDAAEPKTPSGQITLLTPIPGKDGWWFSCCAD